jgi:hypothetical protein
MPLNVRERQAVVREMAERYRKATKGEKGQIRVQVCQLCGYNRRYLARILRRAPRGRSGGEAGTVPAAGDAGRSTTGLCRRRCGVCGQ